MAGRIIIIEDDDFGLQRDSITPNDPCRNCPNNPTNNPHASGFCNCMLPYLNNPIY